MKNDSECIFGISEKDDGQMKLRSDISGESWRNRNSFFERLGLNIGHIVSAGLVHGNNVEIVTDNNWNQVISETDALVTSTPNTVLTVTVSDCLPVYFFDPVKKVVGIAHAGWRGVVSKIVQRVIDTMCSNFGTKATDIVVHVGPHIQKCHFEVQEDVASIFAMYPEAIYKEADAIKIDLASVISKQLSDVGVQEKYITVSEECTHCLDKKYYSFRRDKPETVQAMLAYITIKCFTASSEEISMALRTCKT